MLCARIAAVCVPALMLGACASLDEGQTDRDEATADAAAAETAPEQPAWLTHTDVLFPGVVLTEAPEFTEVEDSDTDYPDDLWVRIREGYGIEADRDNPRVISEINRYSRDTDYLNRVAERAKPYLYHIVSEIEERGMPTELALLPVVESAYRPYAYSHGRAAGIWQFVPATGRNYGLRQSWWYDGRRDVIAATEAALDYLDHLHTLFDGDWMLAIAAYNAGEGRVQNAVRQAEARGEATDFWNLDLPSETRQYVPRLLAISELVQDPEAYDVALERIPDEPQVRLVELDEQIDLAVAADLAGISVERLYSLNPGFDRWATDPDGPHRLAVPADSADAFREKLAELDDDERMRWQRHRIEPGESLRSIARAYNTTPDALRSANDIGGDVIRAGDHLMIPTASAEAETYTQSASNRRARTQAGGGATSVEHVVQQGDTFWDIAQQYGVDVRELAEWNGMAPGDPLRPGQELVVRTAEDGSVQPATAEQSGTREPVREAITYEVRQGDNLYDIAQRFGVSVSQLERWNDIRRDGYLQPGDTLSVQVDVRNQRESI